MLHHYTSIQTLALILKSRKIRFTRIDGVDDIKEIAGFSKNFGTYVFISCWTEEEKENIALWKMYTDNMKGVRISLPNEMFNSYKWEPGKYDGYQVGDDVLSPVTLEESIGENYMIYGPTVTDGFYKKVIYDDTYEEHYNKLFDVSERRIAVKGVQHLGKYKDSMWEFQKESRFALYIYPMLPIDSSEIKGNKEKQFNSIGTQIARQEPTLLKFFDVALNEEAFNKIVVRLGPLCQSADKIIVETLLKSFTTEGIVEDSHLSAVIRK